MKNINWKAFVLSVVIATLILIFIFGVLFIADCVIRFFGVEALMGISLGLALLFFIIIFYKQLK